MKTGANGGKGTIGNKGGMGGGIRPKKTDRRASQPNGSFPMTSLGPENSGEQANAGKTVDHKKIQRLLGRRIEERTTGPSVSKRRAKP